MKPDNGKHNNDVSRRKFLQTAASAGMVAGMVTAAIPISSMAEAPPARDHSRPEDPLERILSRYGSELGDLNQTRQVTQQRRIGGMKNGSI